MKSDFLHSLKTFITARPWLAEIFALLSAAAALAQSFRFAHAMDVTMDEGTYLFKGLLFWQGVYQPFQDYGPLTNKNPLAFFIPGLSQVIFEPGLRSGRYFSIFVTLLMLVGLWLVTRRLAGRGWAAGVVAALAVNPAALMYYSAAISQGITAALVVWSLVFALGRDRPVWELALGVTLAAAAVLTRQNMLPYLGLVVLYVLWENGWQRGGSAALIGLGVFVAANLLYWPKIYQVIWAPLLPGFVDRLLNIPAGVGMGGKALAVESFNWSSKLFSFWEGMRYNFLPLFGGLTALLLWQRRSRWVKPELFRAGVFLAAALLSLTALHIYGALGQDYCIYCFAGYLTFFSPLGLVLLAVTAHSWVRRPGVIRSGVIILTVLVWLAGLGFSAYREIAKPILTLPVPRVRNMRILPGETELWRMLANKFGWAYDFLERMLPAAAGVVIGVLLLVLVGLALRRRSAQTGVGFALLCLLLVLGFVLGPTPVLGSGKAVDLCPGDVIADHEMVGAQLRAAVPAGSLVFWYNDVSPLPLLYVPGVRIFPPQLNHGFNRVEGGNPDLVYRQGYWNEALFEQWAGEADVLLVADAYARPFSDALYARFSGQVDELDTTAAVTQCRPKSLIHIYRRIP